MVRLLPAAALALCTGSTTTLPLPKEHIPTPSSWDACEVVKVHIMFVIEALNSSHLRKFCKSKLEFTVVVSFPDG